MEKAKKVACKNDGFSCIQICFKKPEKQTEKSNRKFQKFQSQGKNPVNVFPWSTVWPFSYDTLGHLASHCCGPGSVPVLGLHGP